MADPEEKARGEGAAEEDPRAKAQSLLASLAGSSTEEAPEPSPMAAFAASDTGEDASRVLRDALRRAPLPSLSGLAFEVMGLAWVFGAAAGLMLLSEFFDRSALVSRAMGPLFSLPTASSSLIPLAAAVPVVLLSARVACGLACIASEGIGQGKGANAWRAWRKGGKTMIAGLGIWLQVFGMMLAATVTVFAPVLAAARFMGEGAMGVTGVVLAGLAASFVLVYGAALGALQELSVASLVRHERGVGSAILHAWRLMRARPRSSQRMAAAEFISRVAVIVVAVAVGRWAGWTYGVGQLVLLGALVGGLRCHAWSLAYPRVGGLAPVH